MQLYHTTDAHGVTEICPSEARMRELIDELDDLEPGEVEHPDVSLIHDHSGWMLSIHPKNIVSIDNLDQKDNAPRFMKNINRQRALIFWSLLAQGSLDKILELPWQSADL
ncbi:MAG TPA: hypothetical protein DCX06_10710 [Opitutae bacterium]|nr:hypothetical protein [Opitutae bacterium]